MGRGRCERNVGGCNGLGFTAPLSWLNISFFLSVTTLSRDQNIRSLRVKIRESW